MNFSAVKHTALIVSWIGAAGRHFGLHNLTRMFQTYRVWIKKAAGNDNWVAEVLQPWML